MSELITPQTIPASPPDMQAGKPDDYCNPWIPPAALDILHAEQGTILDVGGSAPYAGATHILDIAPYSPAFLLHKTWGGRREPTRVWTADAYTQFDLMSDKPWPFEDKRFDLGLCSHTLEDLPDPMPAAREMIRCCRRILVIGPSRLIEQTRNATHPRIVGFPHHHWLMSVERDTLVFRRKTEAVNRRGCHLWCPLGKALSIEDGSMLYDGESPRVERREFASEAERVRDLKAFCREHRSFRARLISDGYRHDWRYWVWKMRQVMLGHR